MAAPMVSQDVLGELGPDHVSDGDYRVAPYLERIDLAFACADLIICRSGAGTVSELTALGLPAIYVPLTHGLPRGAAMIVRPVNQLADRLARARASP